MAHVLVDHGSQIVGATNDDINGRGRRDLVSGNVLHDPVLRLADPAGRRLDGLCEFIAVGWAVTIQHPIEGAVPAG